MVIFLIFSAPARAQAANQPSEWAAAPIRVAQAAGIISDDFAGRKFTENITRADFCALLIQSFRISGYPLPESANYHPFSDTEDKNAAAAYLLGLTSGTGQGVFSPQAALTREMAVAMLGKFRILYQGTDDLMDEKAAERTLQLNIKDRKQISDWAVRSMADAYARGIISGTGPGTLSPQNSVTREQAVVMALNTLTYSNEERRRAGTTGFSSPEIREVVKEYTVSSRSQGSSWQPDPSRGVYGHDHDSSGYRELAAQTKVSFSSATEAQKYMTKITVQVWQLQSDGSKIPGTLSMTVHNAVAEDVKAIFAEIFNGPEQFPIKSSTYSYSFRGDSQHSSGLAIDINPEENYFIDNNGKIKSGKLWKPGENPWSIVPGGDVVQAFNKYGWHWSPDMHWSNGKDYMHFSLSGT